MLSVHGGCADDNMETVCGPVLVEYNAHLCGLYVQHLPNSNYDGDLDKGVASLGVGRVGCTKVHTSTWPVTCFSFVPSFLPSFFLVEKARQEPRRRR